VHELGGQFQSQHAFWGGCGSHSNGRDEQLFLLGEMKKKKKIRVDRQEKPTPLAVMKNYFLSSVPHHF